MKTNRKEFLKITGLGLGGFLFKPVDAFSKNAVSADDFLLESGLVFFNNATIGPSPRVVSDAIKQRIDVVNSTLNYNGIEEDVLSKIADFLNVKNSEIALTHNVTEGINIAAWGIELQKGDEVLMTGHEHVGGILPWLNRKKIDGIVVNRFALQATAEGTFESLKKAITKKTKVIAIPHIPCTIGAVLPIKEISAFAKKRNIVTVIDGAHPLGMMPLDLKDLGCDIYASCFHKWMCGPKGAGMLYVSEEMQTKVIPKFVGGYSADWEIGAEDTRLLNYTSGGHQYYYGTQNSALTAGIGAAIDYQNRIGRSEIYEHSLGLAAYFKSYLLANKGRYELLSPVEEISASSIVSFKLQEKSKELYAFLRNKKIVTRFVPESDLNCNRVSFHLYNTKEQVDLLIKEMEAFG